MNSSSFLDNLPEIPDLRCAITFHIHVVERHVVHVSLKRIIQKMDWADLPKRPGTPDAVFTGSEFSVKAVSILAQSMSPRWCSPSATCQATAATSPRSHADERDWGFADSTLASPGVSPCSPQSFEPSFPPADEETTGASDCFASRGSKRAAQPLSEVRTQIDANCCPDARRT